jgi:pimeloyl-ACP methyl ester carboxylesterase
MIYSITPGDGPPIVLVAALGFTQESWHPVIEMLGAGSATFAYDRPGIGGTPPRDDPSRPVSYGVLAEELTDLLDKSGVDAPAVLVGHSMGANIVRVFADRHPGRVAGLVFVDGSLPRLDLRAQPGPAQSGPAQSGSAQSGSAQSGPAGPGGEMPLTDGDDPGASPIDMLAGEVEVLKANAPRVPAVVLARTPGWWSSRPIPHPALDELWQMNQHDLAVEHHAPLLIAVNAGHHLPREAPALVAYGIDLVVRAARTHRDPSPSEADLAAVGGRVG